MTREVWSGVGAGRRNSGPRPAAIPAGSDPRSARQSGLPGTTQATNATRRALLQTPTARHWPSASPAAFLASAACSAASLFSILAISVSFSFCFPCGRGGTGQGPTVRVPRSGGRGRGGQGRGCPPHLESLERGVGAADLLLDEVEAVPHVRPRLHQVLPHQDGAHLLVHGRLVLEDLELLHHHLVLVLLPKELLPGLMVLLDVCGPGGRGRGIVPGEGEQGGCGPGAAERRRDPPARQICLARC